MTGTNSFSPAWGGSDPARMPPPRRSLIALHIGSSPWQADSLIDGWRVESTLRTWFQSAFNSFFLRHRKGTLQLGDWNDVWGLLAIITLRKCVDQVDYLRETSGETCAARCRPLMTVPLSATRTDREPRPDEAAALSEAIERLFNAISNDDRSILELSLQGLHSHRDWPTTRRALRSVQRVREQIRKRIEHDAWGRTPRQLLNPPEHTEAIAGLQGDTHPVHATRPRATATGRFPCTLVPFWNVELPVEGEAILRRFESGLAGTDASGSRQFPTDLGVSDEVAPPPHLRRPGFPPQKG